MRQYEFFTNRALNNGVIYYPGAGKDLGTMLALFHSKEDVWYSRSIERLTGSSFSCKSKNYPNNPIFVMIDQDFNEINQWLSRLEKGNRILRVRNGLTEIDQELSFPKCFVEKIQEVTGLPNQISAGYYIEIKIVGGGQEDILPFYYFIGKDEDFMPLLDDDIAFRGIIYLKQAAFSGRDWGYHTEEFFDTFIQSRIEPAWVIADLEIEWDGYSYITDTPYMSYENLVKIYRK